MRTRLAPTPSGFLHRGNAVNFLVAWKLARMHNGRVLLRIDDLDAERARPEFIDDVFASLQWLGIHWDEGPRDATDFTANWSQHRRLDRYAAILRALRDGGHLYACTCSRTSVGSCPHRREPLPLDTPDATWRLRVPDNCPVTICTWPGGTRTIDLAECLPDPVLRKRNGQPAYQIASLADDVDHRIDLLVRGEDLLPSTACQTWLAHLLGFASFLQAKCVHHPLIADANGAKLSKSAGAASLKTLRASGAGPEELYASAEAIIARL